MHLVQVARVVVLGLSPVAQVQQVKAVRAARVTVVLRQPNDMAAGAVARHRRVETEVHRRVAQVAQD